MLYYNNTYALYCIQMLHTTSNNKYNCKRNALDSVAASKLWSQAHALKTINKSLKTQLEIRSLHTMTCDATVLSTSDNFERDSGSISPLLLSKKLLVSSLLHNPVDVFVAVLHSGRNMVLRKKRFTFHHFHWLLIRLLWKRVSYVQNDPRFPPMPASQSQLEVCEHLVAVDVRVVGSSFLIVLVVRVAEGRVTTDSWQAKGAGKHLRHHGVVGDEGG